MSIDKMSKLSFFRVGRYEYKKEHICDFTNVPRPHFCMGLLLCGTAVFNGVDNNENVELMPGDIIFVPITSRYISRWSGSPDILYISMHFAFEPLCGISESNNFKLQKIHLENFDDLKEKFDFAQKNYNGDKYSQIKTLGILFDVLGQILPKLEQRNLPPIDERIEAATEYINLHSADKITVEDLAKISGMSTSNFYTQFKKYMKMSPIEYKNSISIGNAMRILKSNKNASVEEISEQLGFESSAYFRRLFKKYTGKSPRDYRQSKIEL